MKEERPRYTMPYFVKSALEEAGLTEDYRARPPYQQNDYIGWIVNARQHATREKRLAQMLEELDRGGIYMKMPHPASAKDDSIGPEQKKYNNTNRDGSAEVDAYLAELPEAIRESLEFHRRMIKAAAAGCTERIAYGMPVFRLGKDLCGIQAHKGFCSFYTMDKSLPSALKEHFPNIEAVSSTIRFYPERPLNEELVSAVLSARLQHP